MPAYNFKQQFAADVASGAKRQTIRARGKRRAPKVGEILSLYTGMRQGGGACRLLGRHYCTSVEAISISCRHQVVRLARPMPTGYGHYYAELSAEEVETLAQADGFPSSAAFFAFFAEQHGGSLDGYLIKW
ncbi:hypothetical protein [Chitiniphilus shinanonensis]|uniref:hypothetical protein n=1 Tax=Chitiniphilus shinanonensis TaxID=553088 RepID=UPI00333F499E